MQLLSEKISKICDDVIKQVYRIREEDDDDWYAIREYGTEYAYRCYASQYKSIMVTIAKIMEKAGVDISALKFPVIEKPVTWSRFIQFAEEMRYTYMQAMRLAGWEVNDFSAEWLMKNAEETGYMDSVTAFARNVVMKSDDMIDFTDYNVTVLSSKRLGEYLKLSRNTPERIDKLIRDVSVPFNVYWEVGHDADTLDDGTYVIAFATNGNCDFDGISVEDIDLLNILRSMQLFSLISASK